MNSLKVPDSGLLLDGTSDRDSPVPPQAFALTIPDSIIQDIINGAKNGKQIQLALGANPVSYSTWLGTPPLPVRQLSSSLPTSCSRLWNAALAATLCFYALELKLRVLMIHARQTLHFGSKYHRIEPPIDDAPHDVFITKPFESTRKAQRIPIVTSLFKKFKPAPVIEKKRQTTYNTSSKSPIKKSSTSPSLDPDIEALQNGLAAHDAARERLVFAGCMFEFRKTNHVAEPSWSRSFPRLITSRKTSCCPATAPRLDPSPHHPPSTPYIRHL